MKKRTWYAQMSDLELLERWLDGDNFACEELCRRYYESLSRFFRNKVSTLADVQDLASQTFLQLLESARRRTHKLVQAPGGIVSFRAFILGIARFVLLDHLRKEYKQRDINVYHESIEALSPGSLSSLYRQGREINVLVNALRALPIADQMLLEAKFFEYLSDAELADLLEIPGTTLPGRLKSAKRRLLELVEHVPRGNASNAVESLEEYIAELRKELARTPRSAATDEREDNEEDE